MAAPAGVRVEPDLAPAPAVRPAEAVAEPEPTQIPTAKSGHVIIVGFGRVGSVVGEALLESKTPFLVVEDAEGRAAAAQALGIEVVVGNAAASRVLALANVAASSTVVIAIPNAFEAGQATEQARRQNPKVLIIARAHSDEEETHLKALGANVVILGEREIGLGMVDVINRDSQAVAEITAADAVEAVLKPLAASAPIRLPADPNLLAEAIEAAQAQVQHADSGPAEPPAVVSAYGEEPDDGPRPDAGDMPDEASSEIEDVADLEALDTPSEPPLPEPSPEPVVAPSSPRPARPATTPGSPFISDMDQGRPFNPEVPPPLAEEEKA